MAACDAEFHEAGIGEGDRAEDLGGQTRDVHRPRIGARGSSGVKRVTWAASSVRSVVGVVSRTPGSAANTEVASPIASSRAARASPGPIGGAAVVVGSACDIQAGLGLGRARGR